MALNYDFGKYDRDQPIIPDAFASALTNIGETLVTHAMQKERDAALNKFKTDAQTLENTREDEQLKKQYKREDALNTTKNEQFDKNYNRLLINDSVSAKHNQDVLANSQLNTANNAKYNADRLAMQGEQNQFDREAKFSEFMTEGDKQKEKLGNKFDDDQRRQQAGLSTGDTPKLNPKLKAKLDYNKSLITKLAGKDMLSKAEQDELEELKLETNKLLKQASGGAGSLNDVISKYKTKQPEVNKKAAPKPGGLQGNPTPQEEAEVMRIIGDGKVISKKEMIEKVQALRLEKFLATQDKQDKRQFMQKYAPWNLPTQTEQQGLLHLPTNRPSF